MGNEAVVECLLRQLKEGLEDYFASPAAGGDMLRANNLSDVLSVSTSRTNLGLGTGSDVVFKSLEVGPASQFTVDQAGAVTAVSVNADTLSANVSVSIGVGAAITSSGPGGALGTAAFTASGAYVPIAQHTGGGILATGGFNLTVPATGTAALLGTANVFTQTNIIPTLAGSASSGGALALSSTTHGTKGLITFGTSAYDEVNNRLGIGTAAPLSTLHIAGTPAAGGEPTYRGNIIIDSGQIANATNGLEFKALSAGSGYGFRLAVVLDGAANEDLYIQSRQNSAAWSTVACVSGAGSNLLVGSTVNTTGKLQITSTTVQQRLAYDASNYMTATVGSTGGVTLDAVGAGAGFTFADAVLSNSPTAGIGYTTGSGGTVTQITSRSTGVTLNKVSGTITTDTTAITALAGASFTVTNSACGINDVPKVVIRSGQTNKRTKAEVTAVAAGSFEITIDNLEPVTAEVGAMILNFVILKGSVN